MAETRDMANKILEKMTEPRYLVSLIAISTMALLYIGGDISKVRLEEQYSRLPEKIKPYDTNRDGILQLSEINRLEQELLRNK